MTKKEKNNFRRAVEWLITNGVVKNQKDMAERMGTTENTISRNKHGGVKRPDDDTLRKFNEQFGSIINIDYLRGESKVMLVKDLAKPRSVKKDESADKTASLLAAKDEIIAGLKREISGKDETIASLKRELAAKDDVVATKDKIISTLQQQIDELRMQVVAEKGLHRSGISHSEAADRETAHI